MAWQIRPSVCMSVCLSVCRLSCLSSVTCVQRRAPYSGGLTFRGYFCTTVVCSLAIRQLTHQRSRRLYEWSEWIIPAEEVKPNILDKVYLVKQKGGRSN